MITLKFYSPNDNPSLSYKLDDEQSQFTALPSRWFDDNSTAYKLVILLNQTVIGFFVLDNGDDKDDYTSDTQSLLLRSMSLNPAFQGKGYAKQALLCLHDFLIQNQITANKIVLGVHHKNLNAQSLYEKVGFVKSKRTYMGKKGLQYIYELTLNAG